MHAKIFSLPVPLSGKKQETNYEPSDIENDSMSQIEAKFRLSGWIYVW